MAVHKCQQDEMSRLGNSSNFVEENIHCDINIEKKNGTRRRRSSNSLFFFFFLITATIIFVIILNQSSCVESSVSKREGFLERSKRQASYADDDVEYVDDEDYAPRPTRRRRLRRRRRRRPVRRDGDGRRQRVAPPLTTTEAPTVLGSFLYSWLYPSSSSSDSSSNSWSGSETTTARPGRVLKKRRRRRRPGAVPITTTTAEPWISKWNPLYRYLMTEQEETPSTEGTPSLVGAIGEAASASGNAFKDSLGYSLIPGLQFVPFVSALDAFGASLALPDSKKEEPSKSPARSSSGETRGREEEGEQVAVENEENRETIVVPKEEEETDSLLIGLIKKTISALEKGGFSSSVPLYTWANEMIMAGKQGKKERQPPEAVNGGGNRTARVSKRVYTFDPTSLGGIVESLSRYAYYLIEDYDDYFSSLFEQPIDAFRDGVKKGLWSATKTYWSTFQPVQAVLVGLGSGVSTFLSKLLGEHEIRTNVPSIMKLHPFYWIDAASRFLLDPLSLTDVQVDDVYLGDDTTPTKVPRKYDPSFLLKLTPNYWVYYFYSDEWKSFSFEDFFDLDNEGGEDDGGGTSALIKMNTFYGIYTFFKSLFKTSFGWQGKNPAQDNYEIDSWTALSLAMVNPYKWSYALFQLSKSFIKMMFDPLGVTFNWDSNARSRNPDDKFTFIIKFVPGYWMFQMLDRLMDPFGNTIRDPKSFENRSEGKEEGISEFTVAVRPYYLARVYLWPVFRFMFDPTKLYTSDFIPENMNWIIDPVLEALQRIKAKQTQAKEKQAQQVVDEDNEQDRYYE